MTVWLFILGAIVLAPLAKGLGERIGRSAPDDAGLKRLRAELEATEQRLGDTERRIALAEERLDFQERLITDRPSVPQSRELK